MFRLYDWWAFSSGVCVVYDCGWRPLSFVLGCN